MIIVNLKGGLGNQMFQYALGKKLSVQNSDILALDISGLDRANKVGDIYRPYALGDFAVTSSVADVATIKKHKYPWGVLSKIARAFQFKVLRQLHIGFESSALLQTGDIYLDGYWQSYKYFDDIREVLLHDFTLTKRSPAAQELLSEMSTTPVVGVHIRRGDYVANPAANTVHGTCSPSYYKAAMKHVAEQVAHPVWFVFSDDPEWVREHISFPSDPVFVSGRGIADAEEIFLMSACTHNIIANSTFSWWGAWLNQHQNKIVIAPTPWTNTETMPYDDLIPPSWIRLPKN